MKIPCFQNRSPSQDVEQVKRAFAKQRAKDLAEFAKNTMAKDRDIEELRKKCQQLTDKLATTQASHPVQVRREWYPVL